MIDCKLSSACHLNYISRKINFISHKLTPIRLLKDLRLNSNLYKIFILPLIRMSFGVVNHLSNNETRRFITFIKKSVKKFSYLPMNTPNRILDKIFGNIADKIMKLNEESKRKLKIRHPEMER